MRSDPPTSVEHVLVVDDDAAIRRIVRDVFDWEGCPVVTANDGREALNRIERECPRVVLLDLWMPVLDGWGVMRELRTRGLDVPVIVMTAGRDARALAAEVGATGYLAKPFELADLLAAVDPFVPCPPDRPS